jgi:CRISPR/Cas system CSM-associated protein Csm2 small subunit
MTSQSHIKTKDGNIPCIKLKDNIFKHTTTTFTLDPFILHNFIEVANPQTSTPRYLYTYNSDEIIKSLENAVSESYKYSTNTYHTFYNINLSETKNKTIAFNKFYEALEKMINTACESDIKQFNKFINELNNLKDHGFSEERKQGIRDALPTDIKYKC